MPKVKSLTGRTEVVRRWKIYTDGRVEDPHGHVHSDLPTEIAFSPQCMALVDAGHLEIAELKRPAPAAPAPAPEPVPEPPAEEPKADEDGGFFKKKGKR